MKIKRNPTTVHTPFSAYSHQIELIKESRLLAMSGQIGVDANGVLAEGVAEQTRRAWQNVELNLLAASMTLGDVVKVTIYLVHECIDTGERRRLFEDVFGAYLPCMSVVYVPALGDQAMKVELDVWASSTED